MSDPSGDPPPIHALGDRPAPQEVRVGIGELSRLNEAARGAFWEVLEPTLPEHPHPKLDELVSRFAERHEVPTARVARALESCRLLLREAARRGVDTESFAADLVALSDGDGEASKAVLMPKYEAAMRALREELLHASLTDHGQLLTRVDWRVDVMKHSQRGAGLETPVVWVTLHYAEGQKEDRVTLQVLPDMLEELMRMCQQVLS